MREGRLLLTAGLLVFGHAIPAHAQVPEEFDGAWDEVAAYFHEQMDEEGVVGGSPWFVHDGEVLADEVHGYADLETRREVDEDTIYHWASITKTLTGIAIMQLEDRGLLDLDDPIVSYLPELRQVHNPFGSMEEITLRHLMSHSAGFRNPTWPWGGDEPWHQHEPTEWSQLVAMVPYTEILFAPGSRYSYSNPGIIFLGRVIEILSGDDYETYMDKNVLDPLGMHRSYYDITPYHLLADRSNNYTLVDGEVTANGLDFDTGVTTSNGGLNAPRAAAAVLERSSLEEMWPKALNAGLEEPQLSESDHKEDLIGALVGGAAGGLLGQLLVCNLRECDGLEVEVIVPSIAIGALIGLGIGSTQ